jgi:cysteine desulfurase
MKEDQSVVLSSGEQPSIYEPVRNLFTRDRVRHIPLDRQGIISSADTLAAITGDTAFCCLIHVHNETGQVSPVNEIAAKLKEKYPGVHIHVDMVQGLGKLPIHLSSWPWIDSASFSGHKIGALKGVGVLFLKMAVAIERSLYGGNQERKLRPGTENLPGAVSMGIRCRELASDPGWFNPVRSLNQELRQKLRTIPEVVIHGDDKCNVGNTTFFHLRGFTVQQLLLGLEMNGICASSGSACSSGQLEPSRALLAMGSSRDVAIHSVRISLGASSSRETVDRIVHVVEKLITTDRKSRA